MAQELIYGAFHGVEYESQHHDDSGLPVGEPVKKVFHDPRIEISWSGESTHLQLGVVHPNDDGDYDSWRYDEASDDDWHTDVFRRFWEGAPTHPEYVGDGSNPKQNDAWNAYWAGVLAQREIQGRTGRAVYLQLTRSAANRLVRAVRTGRDKAFGKDE